MKSRPTLLFICQVYVPDPAAVGQYVADAAEEMARRGHRVVVYTSARGYDDPSRRYPARETRAGVEVRRFPLSSFGKSSIPVRLAAQALFVLQAMVHGLLTRGLCGVVVTTVPPFCGAAGVVLSRLRGVPLKVWVMDLNPDQMVAMGKLGPRSLPVRIFDALNGTVFRQSAYVVVLDRFMAERVARKLDVRRELDVLPPWPLEDHLERVPHEENPFRREHVPPGSFVLMYSGNHSPVNPLGTILDAVERLQDDPRLLLFCVGGGEGKREVEERIRRGARNLRSFPYQPLDSIRFSLSAADAHVVSLGDELVGIVHPCKVYGAMAVARPVLVVGPAPSHVSELLDRLKIGWQVPHGSVERAVTTIRKMMETPEAERSAMGQRAREALRGDLGRTSLLSRLCDVLERGLPSPT